MIDEEQVRAESEKLVRVIDLALDIDLSILERTSTDAAFLATVLDGWISEMMRTAQQSIGAFLEYRGKLDAIVKDMGLDMLRGHKG